MAEVKEKNKHEEQEWDRKKIIIFSALVIVLGFFGLIFINSTPGSHYKKIVQEQGVKGANTQVNVRKSVQDEINNLKTEASNIDLVDVATSSPQIQKVINDLKALKDYPSNQLKQSCLNICQKL